MTPLEQIAVVVVGLVLAFIVFIVIVVVVLRWGSRTGKGLVLGESLPPNQPTPDVSGEPAELVGRRGVAVTSLRPAGTAIFGDQRIDVVTEATFVPQGATVVVTAVEGKRVIVRQATGDPPTSR